MRENRISGAMVTVLVMRLGQESLAQAMTIFGEQIRTSPSFYRDAPVVLELSGASHIRSADDIRAVYTAVQKLGLLPIGIQGGTEAQREAALQLGLPSFPVATHTANTATARPRKPAATAKDATADADAPAVGTEAAESGTAMIGRSKVVTQNVRSGTQIYAQGGDLIILASVSPGAEVIADGHVHIYGALRGRALAGAKGDAEARIFCRTLKAELVSVAGQYMVRENIPEALQGKAVTVAIENDQLTIREH